MSYVKFGKFMHKFHQEIRYTVNVGMNGTAGDVDQGGKQHIVPVHGDIVTHKATRITGEPDPTIVAYLQFRKTTDNKSSCNVRDIRRKMREPSCHGQQTLNGNWCTIKIGEEAVEQVIIRTGYHARDVPTDDVPARFDHFCVGISRTRLSVCGVNAPRLIKTNRLH